MLEVEPHKRPDLRQLAEGAEAMLQEEECFQQPSFQIQSEISDSALDQRSSIQQDLSNLGSVTNLCVNESSSKPSPKPKLVTADNAPSIFIKKPQSSAPRKRGAGCESNSKNSSFMLNQSGLENQPNYAATFHSQVPEQSVVVSNFLHAGTQQKFASSSKKSLIDIERLQKEVKSIYDDQTFRISRNACQDTQVKRNMNILEERIDFFNKQYSHSKETAKPQINACRPPLKLSPEMDASPKDYQPQRQNWQACAQPQQQFFSHCSTCTTKRSQSVRSQPK